MGCVTFLTDLTLALLLHCESRKAVKLGFNDPNSTCSIRDVVTNKLEDVVEEVFSKRVKLRRP